MNDTVTKPSAEQSARALRVAEQLRDGNRDPDFLARTLLYLHDREHLLERALTAAEHYLNSGLGEHEHTALVLAIEKARKAEERAKHSEPPDFGLE
jgi:hypothetical protein